MIRYKPALAVSIQPNVITKLGPGLTCILQSGISVERTVRATLAA